MKFKIDENLPDDLAQLIRDAGWDCSSIVEQQLGGADDPHVAAVCIAEDRILVTFDRGFLNIKTYPPARHPGVIVFRLKSQDKPHVLEVSSVLVAALRSRELRNELWIVHENRIRIRLIESARLS
jgi:predicted nuclease of predicted toxin-antitoxin system